MSDLSDAKRRIVERLKRVESITAPELAAEFGLTDTAIRQHLEVLEAAGMVKGSAHPSSGRGRPPTHWALTPRALELFPDRHADLTVELLESIRTTLGDEALRRVVHARSDHQLAGYRTALHGADDTLVRVRRLADLRTAEGYLADAVVDGDVVTLVEHHCPIREAANVCRSLCDAELGLFRAALGPTVEVSRDQHVMTGAQRCSYTVTPIT